MVREEFRQTLWAAQEGQTLSRAHILLLLSSRQPEEGEMLLEKAEQVRRSTVGNEVHLRGIVEFSNICIQHCLYCGLREDNSRLTRYRMTPSEIGEAAQRAEAWGCRTVVLQSGEDPWFTRDRMRALIARIKEKTNLAITLSVGERTYEDYQAWKTAGVDRYLLKHETASPALYQFLRPGRKLADRLKALNWLQDLGYEVGSGNIVGLPGQTDDDLAADIEIFCQKDFDMIGIGPFIAHPQTPLAGAPNGQLAKTLKVLALTRILTRDANLPATTATGVLEPEGQKKALLAGGNVIMPDVTPSGYREHYEIYPGRGQNPSGPQGMIDMIASLGRRIAQGTGSRVRSRRDSTFYSTPC
jgi:biotin synthase